MERAFSVTITRIYVNKLIANIKSVSNKRLA